MHFDLFINAPALAIKGSIEPSYQDDLYTKTLPFLTVNYRVRPDLSVYAQYAQGFLVPNISALYVVNPQQSKVVPQESTNYQLGGVYAAGKMTFDADVYYIDFQHKIQTLTDVVTGESYETNLGAAIYKGVEAEGTYLLPYGVSIFANGSLNDARGNGDPTNPGYNGHQLAKAPFWTAAAGLRLERHNLFSDDDGWVTTVNNKWIGQQYANAAAGVTPPTALLRSFSEANLSSTYRLGHYAVELQVLNLFDHTDPTAFKGSALIAGTNLPATTVAQGGAANVFTYQAGRSYQLTLRPPSDRLAPERPTMILAVLAAAALAAAPPAPAKATKTLAVLAPGDVAVQAVLAAPPPPDSARTRDELAELHRIAATVTPARMAQARFDDAHEDPSLFAPTLGPAWDMARLPATADLLTLVQQDSEFLASVSKKVFQRPRPWVTDATLKTCDPDDKPLTSYPSGHATLGYALAEALAYAMPARASGLLARADDYAYSREVCAAHYGSDTAASHALASAMIAALMSKPEYRLKLAAATRELAGAFPQ